MHDGGVIAAYDAGDLAVAVVAIGVVADEPPQLVASAGDGLGALASAELVWGDAATSAHGIDELAQAAV